MAETQLGPNTLALLLGADPRFTSETVWIDPILHERWFPLYKRILDAGKLVQILGGSTDTIEPILKAIGSKGVYIYGSNYTIEELEASARIGDRWR